MRKIQARVKQNQALKNKQARRRGPYGLVTDFIKTMETISENAKNAVDFGLDLEREAGLLLDKFKQIDPEVELELKWNSPDMVEDWKDLALEGVLIKWSKFWRIEHPLEFPTKYIDISDLMMKGLLD